MKLSRQIIQGVILTNLVTVVEMATGFLQQVIMIRYLLGIDQYGSLAFFQAGFGMLAIFFNLNLNFSAIRFGGAAQGKEDQEEFYKVQGTAFFFIALLNLALLVVTFMLFLWGFEYRGRVVGEYFFLLAITGLASLPSGLAGTIYQSRKEFRLLTIQQVISSVIGMILVLVFAYFLPTVKGVIYGMIAAACVISFVSSLMVWKDLFRLRLDFSLTRSFGLYGSQFALTSIVKQFFWKADVVLLGLFATDKAVGIYRIAQTVANPLMRAFSPLWTVLFPAISIESGKGNLENVKKLLFRGTQWLVLANLPIVILGSFSLDYLVPLIYGGATAAIFPIRLLLWGYALGTMTCVSPPILRVYRNDLALYTTTAAAGLNILLNLILIPAFNVNGAALTSFISFGLLALAIYYCAFRAVDIPVLPLISMEVVIQIILISLIMVSSVMNFFWISLGILAFLFLFLFRFRIVTVSELRTYLAS